MRASIGERHTFRSPNVKILKSNFDFPIWSCQINQMTMSDNTNWFTLSESAINAIKKPELVQKILVIVDSDISNLSFQISKINDILFQLHLTNKKIRIGSNEKY